MGKKDKYDKLVGLIKLFDNKPHHLVKYLLKNDALKDEFVNKVINNNKLDGISDRDNTTPIFNTISEMEDYYMSFIEEQDKDVETLTNELNEKLKKYISEERYEDAAKVRDYMKRNNINKK